MTDRQTDRQTDTQIDRYTDRQTFNRTNRQTLHDQVIEDGRMCHASVPFIQPNDPGVIC